MNAADIAVAQGLATDFQRSPYARDNKVRAIKPKKAGGSGFIFELSFRRAAGAAELKALKVFRPDQYGDRSLLEGFRRESAHLLRLNHPHIIKGFTAATYLFRSVNRDLPYYVMEYFPHGTLEDALEDPARQQLLAQHPALIRSIFAQVLDALHYMHALRICHLDVKEANILLNLSSPSGPIAKLADLGVAKNLTDESAQTSVHGTLQYWPQQWRDRLKHLSNVNRVAILLPRNDIPLDVDLHMLSVAIGNVAARCSRGSQQYWWRALDIILERMNWDRLANTTHPEKHRTAVAVLKDLATLDRGEALPAPLDEPGSLQVPVRSLQHFGLATRTIVASPWFQRLRNIRQLGLGHLVYPGAMHTRFEHSIGAYSHALAYLAALRGNGNSPWFVSLFSGDELKATALAALLHDIGHYPFAHQLEELAAGSSEQEIVEHELLSHQIVAGTVSERYPELNAKFGACADVLTAIERSWRIDKQLVLDMFTFIYRDKLVRLFAEKPALARDWPIDFRPDVPRSWLVAKQIVNGPIDVDKHDYIMRDAVHSGVPYGNLGDSLRLLSALTVAFDESRTASLGVTEKGRVETEFIAVARYAMFSEVYWHHTVRSFTTMLRRALHNATMWEEPHRLRLPTLIALSDDELLDKLLSTAIAIEDNPTVALLRGIVQRQPYIRLWTLAKRPPFESLYSHITESQGEYILGGQWADDRKMVQDALGVQDIQPHQLLWDVPNAGKDKLEQVRIAGLDGSKIADSPGHLWSSLSPNFEQWVRKVRLFIDASVVPAEFFGAGRRKEVEGQITERLALRHM
jgi:HD superfamily phosphohydrolase